MSIAEVDLGVELEPLVIDEVVVVVGSSESGKTPQDSQNEVVSVLVVAESSARTWKPEAVLCDTLVKLAALEVLVDIVALLSIVPLVIADRQPPAKDRTTRDPVTTVDIILSRQQQNAGASVNHPKTELW